MNEIKSWAKAIFFVCFVGAILYTGVRFLMVNLAPRCDAGYVSTFSPEGVVCVKGYYPHGTRIGDE